MKEEYLLEFLKNADLGKIDFSSISMPNINFPTMGGEVFWNNIAKYKGWRIQENTITHHCRILDPDNVRRAWGSMDAMEKVFKKYADNN